MWRVIKIAVVLAVKATSEVAVHPERAAMIAEIQNTPGVLWKPKAHERFASSPPGASKDLCGVIGDPKEDVDKAVERGEIVRIQYDENKAVPDMFDSETNWPHCAKIIGDIRDQSNCGCCWAFGGIEALSDRMCITTNAALMLPLSAQDVCFNSNPNGCGGGQISTPFDYVKSTGAVSGGQVGGSGPFGGGFCSAFSLPHCHHHGPTHGDPYPAEGASGCPKQSSPGGPTSCDSSAKGNHTDFAGDKYWYDGQTVSTGGESGIQQAIMEGGPVETAFTVYSDFENYGGGIYHHVSGGQVGGHAVKIVGWGVDSGTKYWKVANSWNPYWGEKGYFRMLRGSNEGGFENQVLGSSPTAKWNKGSAPTPPGPAPGPGPAPFPPSPGAQCSMVGADKERCKATQDLGQPCKWCPLGATGQCFEPTVPCPPSPPAPAPPPGPPPAPAPGDKRCVLQRNETSCKSAKEFGTPCRWCASVHACYNTEMPPCPSGPSPAPGPTPPSPPPPGPPSPPGEHCMGKRDSKSCEAAKEFSAPCRWCASVHACYSKMMPPCPKFAVVV